MLEISQRIRNITQEKYSSESDPFFYKYLQRLVAPPADDNIYAADALKKFISNDGSLQ